MQQALRSLAIGDPSSFRVSAISENQIAFDGVYHFLPGTALTNLLRGIDNLDRLWERLAQLAELAFSHRRMKLVTEIGQFLANLPYSESLRQTGQFYKLVANLRSIPPDRARTELLGFADYGPERIRAKALNALASFTFSQNDVPSALEYYIEAHRAAKSRAISDTPAAMLAQSMFPVFVGIEGDSHRAASELERLEPLMVSFAAVDPRSFYYYQNNLAVELNLVGRHEEALYRSNLAVNSPLVELRPGFIETRNEVLQSIPIKNRSRVILSLASSPKTKIEPSQSQELRAKRGASRRRKPATTADEAINLLSSVIPFPSDRISTLATGRKRSLSSIPESELDFMSEHQKRLLLIAIAQSDEIDEEQLDETIKGTRVLRRTESASNVDRYVAEFFPEHALESAPVEPTKAELGPTQTKPRNTFNLESREDLERRVRIWINGGIAPHEFTALLSAIRDCTDDLRRNTLIDQMISFSYLETPDHLLSESEWRRRHESRFEDETDS